MSEVAGRDRPREEVLRRPVEGHETSIYRTLGLGNQRTNADRPLINIRVMAVLAFLKSGRADPHRI
jgi:hypothetical protein